MWEIGNNRKECQNIVYSFAPITKPSSAVHQTGLNQTCFVNTTSCLFCQFVLYMLLLCFKVSTNPKQYKTKGTFLKEDMVYVSCNA